MKVYEDFYYKTFNTDTNELDDNWVSEPFEYSFKKSPYFIYLFLTIIINILVITGIILLGIFVDNEMLALLFMLFFILPFSIVCCRTFCEERCLKDKKDEIEVIKNFYKYFTSLANGEAEEWRKEHPLEEAVRLILNRKDSVEVTKGIKQLVENLEIDSNPILQKLYKNLEDKNYEDNR